jgi:predicted kinase
MPVLSGAGAGPGEPAGTETGWPPPALAAEPGDAPLLVVVYGPPGSGKSTLANALAARLGLSHFDKDEFKDLLFERLGTADRNWSARVGSASWELLVLCTDRLLRSGVSLVIESNVRPNAPIVGQLRHLSRVVPATILGVYLSAADDVLWERFDTRRRTGNRHPGHAGYERRGEFVAAVAEAAHGPIDFGGSSLHLDTSAAWPNLDEVAAWILTARADARGQRAGAGDQPDRQ